MDSDFVRTPQPPLRQPLRVLNQIPKQHPVDGDLVRAKKIFDFVSSTSPKFAPDSAPSQNKVSSIKRNSKPCDENTPKKTNSEPRKPVNRLNKKEIDKAIQKIQEENLKNGDFIKVHDMIPSGDSYVVTSCESADENNWCATVRVAIDSKSDAELWLAEYEQLNSMDFRFRKSCNTENSGRLLFKRQYRCHHNTMPRNCTDPSKIKQGKSKSFQSKNTNCPAYIRITIKQKTMQWSSDILLKNYPCEIVINHTHNHPIVCANALRRRRPSQLIIKKFTDMLQKGYSPLAALQCHKLDLQMEHGEDYFKVSADQSLCPSNFWVYKLANKLCLEEYGPQIGEDMIKSLKVYCEKYNAESKSECVKVDVVDEHLVVVICTPLMKRASRLLKSAGEMLFADSSGTMDCLNCKLFLMQTPSVAGAIPLGAFIVTSESEKVLTAALTMWKGLLPDDAFFGRGPNVGPKITMTDDCSSERNAFQAAFSSCTLLLCLFHILQAFWRYVWNREQNVAMENRCELFFLFRDLVYAGDEKSFEESLDYAKNNEVYKKYPKILQHVEKLIPRAAEWALCYRKNLLTRGNNTDNYSEAGIKVFKEQVLGRSKAYNPVHLLDFVVTRYDRYLKERITDVVNNRASNAFKSRFYVRPEKLEDLICNKLDSPPNTYVVRNSTKKSEYVVVMDLEICSCTHGNSGNPCKHLSAVVQTFNVTSSFVHPLLQVQNPAIKLLLFEVAYGHKNVPGNWFANLTDSVNNENHEGINISSLDATSSTSVLSDAEGHHGLVTSDGDIPEAQQVSQEVVSSLEHSLEEIFSDYKQALRDSPEQFLDAIKAFVSQNSKLRHSQTGLISALHTFGKTLGEEAIGFHHRKRAVGSIPVQPASKARRKVFLGGKKAQCTGRPPKSSMVPDKGDHSYGNALKLKRKALGPAWNIIPKKCRVAAPHDLKHCVLNKQMVGSNHIRK